MTSSVIRDANLLTLTKKTTGKNNKFFGELRTDYDREKVNFPENSLIYINQAYLTIQKNKKIYYRNYFIQGQIIEACNPPSDIGKYELQDRGLNSSAPGITKRLVSFLDCMKPLVYLLYVEMWRKFSSVMAVIRKIPRFFTQIIEERYLIVSVAPYSTVIEP